MILILRRLARKRTLWIRAIYIFLLLILILIYIVCVLYFVTRPQPPSPRLDLNGTYADRQRTSPNDSRIDSTTLQDPPYLPHYELGIRGFDPEIGVLNCQWGLVYEDRKNSLGEDTFLKPNSSANGLSTPSYLYQDVNANYDRAKSMQNYSPNVDLVPHLYYALNNRSAVRLGTLGVTEYEGISTDIDMSLSDESSRFGYPWDIWSGTIALALTSIESIGDGSFDQQTKGEFAWSPYGVMFAPGTVLRWDTTVIINDLCLEGEQSIKNIRNQQGNMTEFLEGFDGRCHTEFNFYGIFKSLTSISLLQLTTEYSASRGSVVRAVVIFIVVMNWLITIAIVLITCEAVFLRRKQLMEGTDMLAVCLTALFALPTIRSILPGAPPQFGAAIDFVGIVPNLILTAICTMIFAAKRIFARKGAKKYKNEILDTESKGSQDTDN